MQFTSREAYEAALKLSGQTLGARYLDIKPAAGRSGSAAAPTPEDTMKLAEAMPATCKTLFVKNLPYSLREDEIGDRFRPFGEIQEVRVARSWTTKQSKGFAYVVFREHESAKAALLKMNGKELKNFEGRCLKVDFDVKQEAKKSYRTNLEDAGNVRYNRQIKKEAKSKVMRKDAMKKGLQKPRQTR